MTLVWILSTWMAAADTTSRYSKDDLDKLIQIADAEWLRLEGRCTEKTAEGPAGAPLLPTPPAVDHEAEVAYMRMAEMRRLAAQHYPYAKLGKDGPQYHSDDIHQGVQLYERAYACNPGWGQRRYLHEAIDMVVARRKQIREDEKRGEGTPDDLQLMEDEKRLRGELAKLRAPVCEPSKTSCPAAPPEVIPSAPPRGYRGRFMDLFSLRVEVGALFASRLYEGIEDNGIADDISAPRGFAFSLAPGVRLLAGKKQRHVFGLGFRYASLLFREETGRDRVLQMAARLEYGLRISLMWFSVHASFEPGIQAHPVREYFGHGQIGGSASVCTWNEALCLRIGGGKSLRTVGPQFRAGEGTFDFATVMFGVDVFRMTDNILRATEGGS